MNDWWNDLLTGTKAGNVKALSRLISLIENEQPGYETLLKQLPHTNVPVIGITGPPGAGKSTLTNALIDEIVSQNKKVAVLCIDPSSPFNRGALLGDRIRMSSWYNHANVFIRSLATRGSLGGLHPKIIEITDLLKATPFDYIIVETVGVGQSEVEIAGLADVTVVVVVPEAGDEIQTMKAGLMEIANVFVVNKADRPEADLFVKNLQQMLAPAFNNAKQEIKVIKTVASQKTGVKNLLEVMESYLQANPVNTKKSWLLTEKAYLLIQQQKMKNISKESLKTDIDKALLNANFNLYKLVADGNYAK